MNPLQSFGYEKAVLAVDPTQFDRGFKNGPRNLAQCKTYQIQGRSVLFIVEHNKREIIDKLCRNNHKRRIILRNDNASSHTAKQTNKFLKGKDVELMINPAFALAPCDFVFFALIKNQLRGQRFLSPEEAVEEYEKDVSKHCDVEANRMQSDCNLVHHLVQM
ncbi:hypothetical protein EVAR_96451_1 [Eumeta japonica]|uniref:Mariner Mos1 transposase n=1 Tax=Eumeta variegata TaxID=151549 RepID=A0A4C1VYF2_EUMVA|nr:hypothetical protein EVAR_96451_1 [Eumeta japonica]